MYYLVFREHSSPVDGGMTGLARGEGAGVDHVGGFLLELLGRFGQRGTRKGHETGAGGFQDTEGVDELHEGVDTGGFRGAINYV